jgi:tetratricopeptide (TPR) repeat protein
MTPGRNDSCTCGSGKKYKKCCLDKDMQSAANRDDDKNIQENSRLSSFESDIDILSNDVKDLIDSRQFGKAREGCQKLLDEYPDQVDGLEHFASLYEAEGDLAMAAEYCRKAVHFMQTNPGFDDEGIDWYSEKAAALEKTSKTQNY